MPSSSSSTPSTSSGTPKYPDRQSLPGSADRNAPLLLTHLTPLLSSLPASSTILELASGSGALLTTLASAFPSLNFTPTEADSHLTQQIAQRVESVGVRNVTQPLVLEFDGHADVDVDAWKTLRDDSQVRVVLVVNVLHIVPWKDVEALWIQVGQFDKGTRVCVYGAFDEAGKRTSEGNEKFNADLKSRNPQYGLRDLQLQVVPLAQRCGFQLDAIDRLPAGNLLVFFTRT